MRSPAGAFRLGEAFGYAKDAALIDMPYMQLTDTTAGVDDIHSRYYNRIIEARNIQDKDWSSAEVMHRSDELYRWGLVIEDNWENIPYAGSCIYMHIWRGPGQGTAGCTAMSSENLLTILHWLRESKHPLLVQLPAAEYQKLKPSWSLP